MTMGPTHPIGRRQGREVKKRRPLALRVLRRVTVAVFTLVCGVLAVPLALACTVVVGLLLAALAALVIGLAPLSAVGFALYLILGGPVKDD